MAGRSDDFEEKKLGKPYDTKILRQLWPFVRPYRILLFCSCFLVILITFIDLSLPYITKLAIDQYIVPENREMGTGSLKQDAQNSKKRYLEVDVSDPEAEEVVRKHSDLFMREKGYALILFDDLPKLEEKDLVLLRQKDLSGVTSAALVFLFAISVHLVLNFSQVMIMEYTGQKIMHDLRMTLFSHLQSLSVAFFTHNSVGRLVTRVTNDVQNMQEIFGSVIVFIFKDLLMIMGVTIILLGIHLKLALISFSAVPFVMYGAIYFANESRDAFRDLRLKVAEINTRFSETIGGIRIIQLFRQEKKNAHDFEWLNHRHYLSGIRQVYLFAVFLRFMGFLDVFVIAIVIFYGGMAVLEGHISLGDLVAFVAYMKMFFGPIKDIAQKYNIMQNAMASAERILLLLDSDEKLPGRPDRPTANGTIIPPLRGAQGGVSSKNQGSCPPKTPPCAPLEGGIRTSPPSCKHPRSEEWTKHQRIRTLEMENVSFGYASDETVLKGISFRVHAGETVAIVGPTGSGKTSLINLIIRFYDPASGQVLINGQDIRDSDIAELRSGMALVTQDPFLFSGTIRENIFHEKNDLSPEKVREIIAASNCAHLVDKLPKGLDTELSEGGASLSSGERQLISVARAFARDPDMIILDEATSYIDSKTEETLQEALANLMHDRTSVIVAHRLSTTRDADKIIVLKKGRIIESGTHHELMKLGGFYFKLNQLQG